LPKAAFLRLLEHLRAAPRITAANHEDVGFLAAFDLTENFVDQAVIDQWPQTRRDFYDRWPIDA
jgi:hypothetical protein